jgi:hypothetical protein
VAAVEAFNCAGAGSCPQLKHGSLGGNTSVGWRAALDYALRIDIAEHSVTFRFRDDHFALEPVVHVSRRTGFLPRHLFGSVQLHGIGREPQKVPGGRRVQLLDPSSQPPDGLQKADCLEVFFRYAVKSAIQKLHFRIKPVAEVHGSQSLRVPLGGYQHEVLERALLRAGASRVWFVT